MSSLFEEIVESRLMELLEGDDLDPMKIKEKVSDAKTDAKKAISTIEKSTGEEVSDETEEEAENKLTQAKTVKDVTDELVGNKDKKSRK